MRNSICVFILTALLLLINPFNSASQESARAKTHEFWHRVSVGGNVGFQFGSITGIVLSPEIRIRLIDQLHLGIGFNYEYLKYYLFL